MIRTRRPLGRSPRGAAVVVAFVTTFALACSEPEPSSPTGVVNDEAARPGAGRVLAESRLVTTFTREFCAALRPQQLPCSQWLQHEANHDPSPSPQTRTTALQQPTQRTAVLIVSGLFSDCVSRWFKAFEPSTTRLNARGYRFNRINVGGRTSTPENANQIRKAVREARNHADVVVLIGYSKGANDVLEALRAPSTAAAVDAAVMLGGSVFGSELIDQLPDVMLKAVEQSPFPGCAASDRGPLQALGTAERAAFMNAWQAPAGVRLYSIAGRPDPERVSRILLPTYRSLAKLDLDNDGQVAVDSSLVPGSRWLAHLNADHWAMALPIEESVSRVVSPLVDQNNFPREALLQAIVTTVLSDP